MVCSLPSCDVESTKLSHFSITSGLAVSSPPQNHAAAQPQRGEQPETSQKSGPAFKHLQLTGSRPWDKPSCHLGKVSTQQTHPNLDSWHLPWVSIFWFGKPLHYCRRHWEKSRLQHCLEGAAIRNAIYSFIY